MSATFACPHCGAIYPVKPVLVGRAVRCTTCKNAFRLRPDGIADAIESAAEPAKSPPPAVVAPKPVVEEVAVEEPPPPPVSPPRPPAPAGNGQPGAVPRRTERMTQQQQDVRRTMASNLATAASQALQSESVKRDVESDQRKRSDRLRQAGGSKREGGVGKISAAVLSGQGTREFRSSLLWTFGSLVVVGSIAALIWWSFQRSPQRQALDAFTAPSGHMNQSEHILKIQDRAWLVGLPPFGAGVPPVNAMWEARFSPPLIVKLEGARKTLTETLKGQVFLANPPVWVAADKADEVRTRWADKAGQPGIATLLTSSGIPARDVAEIRKQLAKDGLSDVGVSVLLELLLGKTDRSGGNRIAKRLLDGDLPDLEIVPFQGYHGTLLSPSIGNHSIPVKYRGRLLRFIGKDWDLGFKVLDLVAVSESEDLPTEK